MLSPKKASGVALGSLVALLVATACGTPNAAPKPSPTIPTIYTSPTSPQVTPTPVPSNNAITVKPTSTTEAPSVDPTTEAPPPAPPPPSEPAPPAPLPEQPTDPVDPSDGPFVLQGAACEAEGAIAVNRRLRPMVCAAGAGGELRWQPL